MWSQHAQDETAASTPVGIRDKLLIARARMKEALILLDEHSLSAAAASLDLALCQLDRELS